MVYDVHSRICYKHFKYLKYTVLPLLNFFGSVLWIFFPCTFIFNKKCEYLFTRSSLLLINASSYRAVLTTHKDIEMIRHNIAFPITLQIHCLAKSLVFTLYFKS